MDTEDEKFKCYERLWYEYCAKIQSVRQEEDHMVKVLQGQWERGELSWSEYGQKLAENRNTYNDKEYALRKEFRETVPK